MTCTFFGHRDAPSNIEAVLKSAIEELIHGGVTKFYVGNNGAFDLLLQVVLGELCKNSKDVSYAIVLSRINERALSGNQEATIFPDGLESVPPRFAIAKRNDWLLRSSQVVVVYSLCKVSNSYKLMERARKKGLRIINIASIK